MGPCAKHKKSLQKFCNHVIFNKMLTPLLFKDYEEKYDVLEWKNHQMTGLIRSLTGIRNDGVYSGIAWLKACGDNRANTVYPIIVHNSALHNRFI